jgi:thioredoxin 1
MISTLGSDAFTEMVLDGQGPIAVEFMSYGCGYCRAIEPLLQQVAQRVEGQETIFRVNIAASPNLAADYAIGGTPTFVMFLDGQEVGRVEGPDPTLSSVTQAVTGPFVS